MLGNGSVILLIPARHGGHARAKIFALIAKLNRNIGVSRPSAGLDKMNEATFKRWLASIDRQSGAQRNQVSQALGSPAWALRLTAAGPIAPAAGGPGSSVNAGSDVATEETHWPRLATAGLQRLAARIAAARTSAAGVKPVANCGSLSHFGTEPRCEPRISPAKQRYCSWFAPESERLRKVCNQEKLFHLASAQPMAYAHWVAWTWHNAKQAAQYGPPVQFVYRNVVVS